MVQANRAAAQLARNTASQQVAALSTNILSTTGNLPYNTDLRALAAWQTAPTAEARSALLASGTTAYAGKLPGTPTGQAWSLAVSADGRLVAEGSGCTATDTEPCGELTVWDAATRRVLLNRKYAGIVSSVAFSPDSRLLAVSAVAGTFQVQLWDTRTGARRLVLNAGSPIRSVSFSPGGRELATGETGQVAIRNPATGAPERVLPLPHGDQVDVDEVEYSADGRYLVAEVIQNIDASPTTQIDNSVLVWDTHTWRLASTFPKADAFALAQTGSALAITDGDNLRMRDPATGRGGAAWSAGTETPYELAFVPHTADLLDGTSDGTVVEWDTGTHKAVRTFLGASSSVHALGVSPDGSHLLSTSNDGDTIWWNLDPAQAVRTLCRAVSGPGLTAAWTRLAGEAEVIVGPQPC